jgi:hypothetical protein
LIPEKDRAYCAGLYEGEGSIVFTLRSQKKRDGSSGKFIRGIVLSINMTDVYPLELFEDIIGYGSVIGPFARGETEKGSIRKPYYRYYVTGFERVQFAICQLWDWLSPRRKEQIEKAFTSYTSHHIIHTKTTWRNRKIQK